MELQRQEALYSQGLVLKGNVYVIFNFFIYLETILAIYSDRDNSDVSGANVRPTERA